MHLLAAHLRRARTKYNATLRGLAREEDLSHTQLWRVEAAQEQASERVLEVYSRRFRMNLDELCRLRGVVPSDVKEHLAHTPGAVQKVRRSMRRSGTG